jgi:hypothetical protein
VAVHVANAFAHEKNGGSADASGIDMEYLTQLGFADRVVEWRGACFAEES